MQVQQSRCSGLKLSTILASVMAMLAFAKPTAGDAPMSEAKRSWSLKRWSEIGAWGDIAHLGGWRIQRNANSKACRVLDGWGVSLLRGTLDQCRQHVDALRARRQGQPSGEEVVVILHGLGQDSRSMTWVNRHLRKAGFRTVSIDYPSNSVDLATCASYVADIVSNLEDAKRIHFVSHSMGGLVLRTWLGAPREHDDRLGRVVMLGTPNHGAELVDLLHQTWLFKLLMGPAAAQLVTSPTGFIASLPAPQLPFAVITGSRGTNDGWNPLIPGDDDGLVSVKSARLEGAEAFVTLPIWHAALVWDERSLTMTERFLKGATIAE